MNAKPGMEVIEFIQHDDADRLKHLLESGVGPDSVVRLSPRGGTTFTLLEHATQKGARAVMRLLIDAGAKINEGKFKPLILATMANDLDTVKLLLDAGADPNVQWNDRDQNKRGLTALMYAVGPSRGIEMIELLLAGGADPNILTDKGNSALSYAISYENIDAVNTLLRSGCKPQGNVLLDAIYKGQSDLVATLTAAGADVSGIWNWRGETGTRNILQGAVSFRAENITTLRSPLTAQRNRFARVKVEADGRLKIVETLVRAGAEVNRSESPTPPLYLAARGGDLETVKLLLQAGADPNPPQGRPFDSPLHAACRGGFEDIVECLLKAGADAKIKNPQGLTALEELRQLTKPKEIQNWERAVQEGARIEPGLMDATIEEWNKNRARLIELLANASAVPVQGADAIAATKIDTYSTVTKKQSPKQRIAKVAIAPSNVAKQSAESEDLDCGLSAFGLRSKDCRLPDGSSLSLWVATDTRISEWTYFSIIRDARMGEILDAWYRVFQPGAPPPDWQAMKPIEEVYKKTGFDDSDEKTDDPQETEIGAAEKLPAGEYILEVKVQIRHEGLHLGAMTFAVQ